jgi:hypothetical protein
VTFLAPLGLVWLSLLVPLVLLYVLKRRRTELAVGSTLLWEAALRDLRAERPFRRLLLQAALILQALALAAGAVALARPATRGALSQGAQVAVVVDVSPSMLAASSTAGAGTRLDDARGVARAIARGLPPGGRMMLVEAGEQPSVAASAGDDADVLGRAIDGLGVRGRGADLEPAIALAAERLRGAPSGSRIVVLTDLAFDGEVRFEGAALSAPVEVQALGGARDNTAIVAADVRPGDADRSPDAADVFVRLERFGARAADVYVTAEVEGRGVVASRRLRVAPGEPAPVVMAADLPPDGAGRPALVRIAISHADGAADALALDDVVVVPSPGSDRLPVFLVGEAPRSVARVLAADPRVELFETSLAAMGSHRASAADLDGLIVFAREAPAAPPRGAALVIAPTASALFGLEIGAPAEAPRITTWDEDDPRFRFVSMAGVHLGQLRPIGGQSARPVLRTSAGTAIAVLGHPSGEVTVLSFDPDRGDWPLDPSFVVFFHNVLELARARRAEGGVPPGDLGEPLRVSAPEGARVEVTTPSGATISAESRGGIALVPVPPEPGVFRVALGESRRHALRSLRDRAESDLNPRGRIIGGGRAAAPARAATLPHRERWRLLAALLLALIVAECLVAARRIR